MAFFLLSHSIRFPFSWLLFDCPSEAFPTGLLNNATPSLPVYGPVPPPSSPASPSLCCFHFISSFRELSSPETGNNDLLHPEECPSPPLLLPPPPPNNPVPLSHRHPLLDPNFLNLNKMRIPQSLKNASPSVSHARKCALTLSPSHSSPPRCPCAQNFCPTAVSLGALCLALKCKVPMLSQGESLNAPCHQYTQTHTQTPSSTVTSTSD